MKNKQQCPPCHNINPFWHWTSQIIHFFSICMWPVAKKNVIFFIIRFLFLFKLSQVITEKLTSLLSSSCRQMLRIMNINKFPYLQSYMNNTFIFFNTISERGATFFLHKPNESVFLFSIIIDLLQYSLN